MLFMCFMVHAFLHSESQKHWTMKGMKNMKCKEREITDSGERFMITAIHRIRLGFQVAKLHVLHVLHGSRFLHNESQKRWTMKGMKSMKVSENENQLPLRKTL